MLQQVAVVATAGSVIVALVLHSGVCIKRTWRFSIGLPWHGSLGALSALVFVLMTFAELLDGQVESQTRLCPGTMV